MTLDSGSRLGSYEIVSLLGSGGMGDVYKAKDLKLGRTVAIKLLQKNLAADPERLKSFEQEARAASALDHPNIVTIHDIAEVDGQHFIVMQYVEGKTLRELMAAKRLPLSKTIHYAIQIADGLARAHSHGIVHRDLKPDNIMVTEDGLVKILDFGLAKLIEPSDWTEASTRDLAQPHTKEGHIVGTAPYMSPEQAQGQKVDARSDIFSFGSVLYEMVTGRRAFSADSMPELLVAIIKAEPDKASDIVPSMPLDLGKAINRALKKEADRRFQSMADVRVELQEIKEELDSGSFVSAEQVRTAAAKRLNGTWARVVRVRPEPTRALVPEILRARTDKSGNRIVPNLSWARFDGIRAPRSHGIVELVQVEGESEPVLVRQLRVDLEEISTPRKRRSESSTCEPPLCSLGNEWASLLRGCDPFALPIRERSRLSRDIEQESFHGGLPCQSAPKTSVLIGA